MNALPIYRGLNKLLKEHGIGAACIILIDLKGEDLALKGAALGSHGHLRDLADRMVSNIQAQVKAGLLAAGVKFDTDVNKEEP